MKLQQKILAQMFLLTLLIVLAMSLTYFYLFTTDIRERSQQALTNAFAMIFDDLHTRAEFVSSKLEFFLQTGVVNPMYMVNLYREQQALSQPLTLNYIKKIMTYLSYMTSSMHEFGIMTEASQIVVYDQQGRLLACYRRQADAPNVGVYLAELHNGTFVEMPPKDRWYVLVQNIEDIQAKNPPEGVSLTYPEALPESQQVLISSLQSQFALEFRIPIRERGSLLGVCVLHLVLGEKDAVRYAGLNGAEVDFFVGTRLSVGTLSSYRELPMMLLKGSHPLNISDAEDGRHFPLQFNSMESGGQAYYQGSAVIGMPSQPVGAITIHYPRQLEAIQRRRFLLIASGITVVFSLIAVVQAFGISSAIVRPIAQLVAAMNVMQSGGFDIAELPASRDEIGLLSQTFATMSRQLQENFEAITRYNDSLRAEIAEREQAESALRESEARYRGLFDDVPVGLFRITPAGQILDANWAFVHLLGYSTREALIAHTAPEFYVNPQDHEVWKSLMAQDGIVRDFEVQWRRSDGKSVWIKNTGHAVRNEQGEIVRYEGSLEDITERKRADEELTRYRDHLEELVNARTTALQAANVELRETLHDLQQTQSQLIQSEKMAALGKLIANIAHEINTPLGAIRASTVNIASTLAETTRDLPPLLRMLPSEQYEAFCALLARATQPKPAITSREERAHRRVVQGELGAAGIANAERIAGTFVDMGVYADVTLALPLLQSDLVFPVLRAAYHLATQHHHSANILAAVERMSKIIFALKSYAHTDASGEATMARVTDGMDVVLTLYHNQLKQGIEVVKQYADVPLIRCYPDELNQVWTNLIHNAIQAMNGKGRLEIAVTPVETHGRASLHGGNGGASLPEGVVVEITDSGSGIPDNIKPRIFEPFFTTKPAGEGSGLGLDISRKIIEKHQGTIEFDSQPGRTTFRVWLPVS